MKCPECGIEMMIYDTATDSAGTEQVNYVCRNPACGLYDRRLARKPETETAQAANSQGS